MVRIKTRFTLLLLFCMLMVVQVKPVIGEAGNAALIEIITGISTERSLPVAGFSVSSNEICAQNGSASVVITSQSINATLTEWIITNNETGVSDSFTENATTFEYQFSGLESLPVVFTITQIVSNDDGAQDEKSRDVAVNPGITAIIHGTESGCHPLTLSFEHQTPNATMVEWEFSNGMILSDDAPSLTFYNNSFTEPADHFAKLTVTSEYGCVHDTTMFFQVFPKPKADFSLPFQQVCAPELLEINDQSFVSGSMDYYWTFGVEQDSLASPGNITLPLANQGDEPFIFPIGLIVENEFACKDSSQANIVVFPEVTASFQLSEQQGCHPLQIEITNTSTGPEGNMSYFWDYGNGTSVNSAPLHHRTFLNNSHIDTQEYLITLEAASIHGCTSVHNETITVFPGPKAEFEADITEGCSPLEVNFTDLSAGDQLDYSWNFGNDSFSEDPGNVSTVFFSSDEGGPVQFNPSLEIVNSFGCSHTYQQTITVYPFIEAAFTRTENGCSPLNVIFENRSIGASSWFWEFGDGNQSFEQDLNHTFFNTSPDSPAEFIVSLTASSIWGCEAIATDTIVVFPVPHISFNTSDTEGCSPLNITITNHSAGASEYTWHLNGESSNSDESIFDILLQNSSLLPDTTQIVLEGINDFGCSNQDRKDIVVFPEVTASFYSEDDLTEGCSPLHLTFINESAAAHEYLWEFGDGISSGALNPSHIFIAHQNLFTLLEVTLTATSEYGCTDMSAMEVSVFPQPYTDFEASPHEQFYPEKTFFINNYTSPGQWTYRWDMGDGHVFETDDGNSFQYTYQWEGEQNTSQSFIISLDVFNEMCNDNLEQEVRILPASPDADFEAELNGCPPLEIQFENLSLYASAFHWDFGDGNTSEAENPVHVFKFPGQYEVVLTAYSESGLDTHSKVITVFEPPVASFTVFPEIVQIPGGWAQMINQTELGHTWQWDFGDGNTSEEKEPVHYYTQPGTFTINLVAGSETEPQCFDETSRQVVVIEEHQDALCHLYFPNAFTPNPTRPTGGHYVMGDPANEVFHPRHAGITEFEMHIFNRWGERIFTSKDVNYGWDGYLGGKAAPMGVYIYKVKAKCETGREFEETGDITLLR